MHDLSCIVVADLQCVIQWSKDYAQAPAIENGDLTTPTFNLKSNYNVEYGRETKTMTTIT